MNINYADSCNFKPIPSITPLDGYWQNGTWKFNMSEITAGAASQPSWIDIILKGNTALTLINAKEDSLNYLKLFGGCEQRNLPVGYTQVDGVTNASGGYIDTGIVADVDDMEYDVVATYTSSNSTSWYLLQSRANNGSAIYGISGSTSNNTFIGAFSGINISIPYSTMNRQNGHTYHVNFVCKNGTGTITVEDLTDGTTATATDAYTFTAATSNTGLFSNFVSGGTLADGCTYVLSAYIKKSGVKVMDYTSCTQSSVAGFYDKVTNSLKGATSGSFVAGTTTVPSPITPMDIVCNNGVLTFGVSTTYNTADGQGTFVTPSPFTTNRIYKAFGKLKAGKYKVKITGDFEFIFQYKDTNDMSYTQYGNVGTWTTEGEYEITDTSMYYGVAIRNGSGSGSINPSSFDNVGTIGYTYLGVTPVGTVETVGVTGKNLLNPSEIERITTTQVRWCYQDGYLLKAGKTYTFSTNYTGCYLYFMRKSDNTSLTPTTQNVVSYTPTEDILAFFRAYKPSSLDDGYNYQLEFGSTATTYEPYYNGGTATAEMLLKVGNYQDVQSVLDGVVTRNVGIKPITGDMVTNYFATSNRCTITTGDIITTRSPIMCSHFPVNTSTGDYYINHGADNQYIYCYSKDCSSLNDYKNFFDNLYNTGVPAIIAYPLQTPTIETVTGQPLTIQAGTNVVAITQASMDNLELEVSYKAGVEVTVTEIENAQLDNSVTVTVS